MIELKPCPFCGRPACVVVGDMIGPGKWYAQASCGINRGCGITIFAEADSAETARKRVMDAWNITAEPVKHGRWVERLVNIETLTTDLFCSECKFASVNWRYNYCPNCGAKMDEEGSDD